MTSKRHLNHVRSICLLGALLAFGLGDARAAVGRRGTPPIGAYTTHGAWSFVSAPKLHPPRIQADAPVRSSRLAHGLFLVATLPNTNARAATIPMSGEGGPLILDNRLEPVWVMPAGTHVGAADLQQQTYDGKPVLTWWQGTVNGVGGTKSGEDIVVDQRYRRVATLKAQAPWVISEHDMVITPPHDAWVTVYRYVRGQNLTRFHGSAKATVYDVGVQEYDLSTGKLLYTWDAINPGRSPNIPLSDSELRPVRGTPWDAYHINALQPMGSGQFLVSLRNTWAVYLIDQATGHVAWKLGGDPHKPSTFAVARNARFQFQHDVRLSGSQLTMFDDACCNVTGPGHAQPPLGPSRGLILHVDFTAHRVTLEHQYVYPVKRQTYFLGSTRILPNGNVLVGWGSQAFFTEYSRAGRVLLDAAFPGLGKDINYRALLTPSWVGTPYYSPSAVLRRTRGAATVYVSWNGATQVARWEVLAGGKRLAAASRSGFETAIRLGTASSKALEVKALDAAGHVIGSARVRTR